MALDTQCVTPGAVYRTHISDASITVVVDLPATGDFALDEQGAAQLERNLHNAVELALAPLFARAAVTALADELTRQGAEIGAREPVSSYDAHGLANLSFAYSDAGQRLRALVKPSE